MSRHGTVVSLRALNAVTRLTDRIGGWRQVLTSNALGRREAVPSRIGRATKVAAGAPEDEDLYPRRPRQHFIFCQVVCVFCSGADKEANVAPSPAPSSAQTAATSPLLTT